MNTAVLISTFLAASIEVIEMVAIVVAVGATRQWRGALAGTLVGLLVLAVLIAALGTGLQRVPLSPIRVVVGALLLTFGLQWVRKGVRSVSRDGWTTGIGEQQVEEDVGDGFDWTGFLLAFRGVSLEGLEIAVIVVAFGAADHAIASAAIGAVASVLLIGALGLLWLGAFYIAAALVFVRVVSYWRRGTLRRLRAQHPLTEGASR